MQGLPVWTKVLGLLYYKSVKLLLIKCLFLFILYIKAKLCYFANFVASVHTGFLLRTKKRIF